tara:strand:- start:2060 stop:3400 length:1341 start_codon:yes stop_codon:yes gene_type:complete
MPLYKFTNNDLFQNQIKTYPQQRFVIYSGSIYHNNKRAQAGALVWKDGSTTGSNVTHVPTGHVNLYELNVDRDESSHTWNSKVDADGDGIEEGGGVKSMIFPFITKEGTLMSFSTVSTSTFQSFAYGSTMTSSYPLSASVGIDQIAAVSSLGGTDTPECGGTASAFPRRRVRALKNVFNYYKKLSPHFGYTMDSSGIGMSWNKEEQQMALVNVPSIFYGSSIKKGTVDLKFYVSGTLIGQLQDTKQNGELVQVFGSVEANNGKVAGVVLYNEGVICLTGSWDLHASHVDYYSSCAAWPDPKAEVKPAWVYWGTTGSSHDVDTMVPSSSFTLDFSGTNYVPVVTMLAHAPKNELNHSNNPTFMKYGQDKSEAASSGANHYYERDNLEITNTVKTRYTDTSGSFRKQTWISKVGIYDKDRNLIGIAKLATPLKKTEEREYTFKLKLDF